MDRSAAPLLSPDEETTLLRVARDALETYIRTKTRIDVDVAGAVDALRQQRAAFVTLTKHGELRGCIGSTLHSSPLLISVRDNAVRSGVHDPRFSPVTVDELADLVIEISALADGDQPGSPFRRVHEISEIVIGEDGLHLQHCGRPCGLLLPQVASDRDWTVEQFLEAVSRKSGLTAGAWRDAESVLYRFSAQVFAEADRPA